jgi:5-methylcytosine-specific restriction enzyme subunit McrC
VSARIPVENIYYLLSYAWDRLEERDLTPVTVLPDTKLVELLARVLQSGVTHLLKRGLDRSYVTYEDEIPGVRGRLDLGSSIKRSTFSRARAWCAFDELSPDVLHNRIVKTTLRQLSAVEGLEVGLAEQLRSLYRRLAGVGEITITTRSFRRTTLGRNNAYYGFLLDVCEIVHRNLLVSEGEGTVVFRDFTRDDVQMARLFERFLFRFYQKEQSAFEVDASHLSWNATGTVENLGYLPRMRTDIELHSADTSIVIDAKYYSDTLTEHFGKASVHSAHLYQLFAYLRHVDATGPARPARGMLIYPRTTKTVRIDVTLFEHPVTVATVNLAQGWEQVREDLLSLLPGAGH